jgi:ornithine carbamoyltransferase
MIGSAKMGLHFRAVAPQEVWPEAALVEKCKNMARETGATITLTEDVQEGTKDADVIYTDVWVSMGEPKEMWEKRIALLTAYRVTMDVMDRAADDAIFMHCLPAFHNLETEVGRDIGEAFGLDCMEVSEEVFESDYSVVFDQAENRMHTIKAVMYATLL